MADKPEAVTLALLQSELELVSADRRAYARLAAAVRARSSLLDFMRFIRPDPEDVDDAERSRYVLTPLARLLCQILEKVERCELMRVAVSVGPQFGKSEVISRGFPAWYMGRNPRKNFILGTYNQDFAEAFGGEVREICTSPEYRQVFPDFEFRQGSAAKDSLVTMEGGKMAFAGRGASLTGRPGDIGILEDILKDDKEAQSPTIRREAWMWLMRVVFTRIHSKSPVVLVATRWQEDDPIGRMCDPAHPEHDPVIAKMWTYINLPAVVKSPELAAALGLTLEVPTDAEVVMQFGSSPMASLWPERKPLRFLAEARRLDPKGFEALYMGNPTPEDGEFFKREWLVPYKPDELPARLTKYAASDHAISEAEGRDFNCFGTFGVDEHGVIWLLPDLYWEREADTNIVVDVILDSMRLHRHQIWWAERSHISKAILPFLRKRMIEENVMQTLMDDSMVPSADKKTRARSFQGMMSLKRIRFPTFAPWWQDAQNELLKFPNGTHDDFVDMCAYIGLGLAREMPASRQQPESEKVIRVGSYAWIRGQTRMQEKQKKRLEATRGM